MPSLTSRGESVRFLTDPDLRERSGVIVAFSERTGGVSPSPYDSLNLASHVGDDPEHVDVNRDLLMQALGIADLRASLVVAERWHGYPVTVIGQPDAGRGAYAGMQDDRIPGTDAMLTSTPRIPLMMLYADCVPVVLVEEAMPVVCVVHAGWRGALSGVVTKAVASLSEHVAVSPSGLSAYIGPSIGGCCYEVGEDLASLFRGSFDTISAAEGRIDLAMAVHEHLIGSGLSEDRIVHAGLCTLDNSDRFFSFRGQAVTGRHGAIAVIEKGV